MKWLLSLLLGLLFLGYLALVFYANRATYSAPFDAEYWQDKYENSQWRLPQSPRGIGDDGLYLYLGYKLIHGADPTLENAEMPPLGKYLIGSSIVAFGNGNIFGFATTTVAVLAFFFLAILLLPTPLTLVTTLLVAVDPLIASQFPLTMFESLQLLFLLTTTIFLMLTARSVGTKRIVYCILAGVSFGLFSGTKFPLFAPVIAGATGWIFWQKTQKDVRAFTHLLIFFFGSASIAYLVPYFRYFQLNHSIFSWISVQKWILNFYLHANLTPTWGSMLATVLTGFTQNIFTRSWGRTFEWTPVWTIVFLITIIWMFKQFRKRKTPTIIPAGAIFATIVLLNVIPFWSRYLVILLPFLYLIAATQLIKLPKPLLFLSLGALLLVNSWRTQTILFPTPEKVVAQVVYDWQNGLFQDLYEHATDEVKAKISRSDFHRFGQTIYHDGQIEEATITVLNTIWHHPWESPQFITLDVTYHTRNLGNVRLSTQLPMVYETGRWRAAWKWDNIMAGIDESKHLETTVIPAKRGTITDKTKAAPVVRDMDSWLVWVTPKDIDKSREEAMLQFLQGLFDKRAAAALFHLRYSQQQPDMPIALGVARVPLEDAARKELLSYPGLTLTPAYYRWVEGTAKDQVGLVANTAFVECCSFLYNTTAYDGVSGWERQYNQMLKGTNGGNLVIKDKQGNVVRTILSVEKQDGQNVKL